MNMIHKSDKKNQFWFLFHFMFLSKVDDIKWIQLSYFSRVVNNFGNHLCELDNTPEAVSMKKISSPKLGFNS